jgi:hypothetical protein
MRYYTASFVFLFMASALAVLVRERNLSMLLSALLVVLSFVLLRVGDAAKGRTTAMVREKFTSSSREIAKINDYAIDVTPFSKN